MKRRTFIKNTAAAGVMAGVGGLGLLSFSSSPHRKHITILHTNDTHSHVEPFSGDHSQFPDKGGVARRYSLIQQIRKENPHTLLLDAGDMFQGTPFFNFYGGELELKLMSKLGYDAATIGNHEFDNGIDGLLAPLPHANFPLISSNYDFSNTDLEGQIKPYEVFERDGIKIGVFGLGIQLEGLVSKKLYQETRYLDPVDISQDMVARLKTEENCQLIICLSHLGYQYGHDKISDLKLARATKDIDLIIGGHTHTFLPKPTIAQNKEGKNLIINQVGWAGINLGRIDFYLDENGNIDHEGATILV